jgi:hypothetical protein
MQLAITLLTVVAGLIFSIAVALAAEELIFGQLCRLFFAKQMLRETTPLESGQKR